MDELLNIAAEVFIKDGFEGASTNEIVRLAGASKASLYSRFPTKEDLFLAVLERRMNTLFEAVAGTIPLDAPIREALFAFGSQILTQVLSEDQLSLLRLVSMETRAFPQLGKRFFELGPGRGLTMLSIYLKNQVDSGKLRREDPQMMAQLLLGMISGLPLLFRLLQVSSHLKTSVQQRLHLEAAVDSFLRSFGATAAKSF